MNEKYLPVMDGRMTKNFGAVIEPRTEYERFLEEDQRFVAGYTLKDEKINFELLSEGDLDSLSEEQRKTARQTRTSPFKSIMVIFYEEGNEVFCKYIGGMASDLRFATAKMIAGLKAEEA